MGRVGLVGRYYTYRATVSAGFYLPVSVVYLTRRGLGLAEIGAVQAVFLFALVAAEIPTGYLGDRIGRRAGLAIGNATLAAVMGGFVLAETTAEFAVVYAVWAVAWTFRSGTAAAWLYELLASVGRSGEFTRISGRADAVLGVTSAATAVAGGWLFTIAPAAPFLANGVLAALGVPVLFTLPETGEDTTDADDRTETDPLTVREAIRTLRAQVERAEVRWLVAYAALFNVAFSLSRVFEQPAARDVGVSVAGLGAMYAVFKLVSAGASALAGPAEEWLGRRGTLAALVPLYGVAYGLVGLAPTALLPALVLNRGLDSLVTPVRNGYLNDRLADLGRATVLSGVSMALSVASGAANAVGGYVAESVGAVTFLWTATVAVAAAGGVVWLATNPVRSPAGGESGVGAD